MTRITGDVGSASVWVLVTCALVLLVAVAVQIRALAVLARHRAESAADLAALAAAGQIGASGAPCAAAARVASAGGVRLASCVPLIAPDGRSGTVTVRVADDVRLWFANVRSVSASARAARDPPDAAAVASRVRIDAGDVGQDDVEQTHRTGLVQRLVAVSALG